MLGATLASDRYLERLQNELAKINENALQRWADLIYEAWEQEKFVFIFGNGGSGTTASHMAEDLGKSTLPESELQDSSKKRLKVLSEKYPGLEFATGSALIEQLNVRKSISELIKQVTFS